MPSMDKPCTRIHWHFVGQAVHLLQGFSLHLQLHLRILFEDFGVALPEQLGNPLVGDTAGTHLPSGTLQNKGSIGFVLIIS
jgi:hypothetical protein